MLEHVPPISLEKLSDLLTVGDCVFIRIPFKPFRLVAAATGSWTNHVGVVIDCGASGPVIAESKFPFSRKSSLRGFLGRSECGRVAVSRLNSPISGEQRRRLMAAATRRLGTFYDTGFDLRRAHRQFCSRYVREVLAEATGISVGEVESFATLLSRRPNTDLNFWTMWYFGRIPWSRETVSPASLLASPNLAPLFDGFAMTADSAS
jgi:hypothetical protein